MLALYLGPGLTPPGLIGLAPAAISLSSSNIDEDATIGATVGVLSVTNGSGSYTFTITADPDNKFDISGSNLITTATLNYGTATSHAVTIQADNGVDTPITREYVIAVNDVITNATFIMAQLDDANRIYQRATTSGGGESKGQGSITVGLSSATAGPVYARCRSAADGSTILQAEWLAATIADAASSVEIAGVDARTGWFYIDLKSDETWQLGTTPVGMGHVTMVSGQSLGVRMFGRTDSQTATNASLGVSIDPNSAVYATYTETGFTLATPTWTVPADGSDYDSTFAAEYLRLMVAASGVNCALTGHCKSNEAIASFIGAGSEVDDINTIMSSVEGFEAFLWIQGHSDSQAGTSSATYQTSLDTLLAAIEAGNSVRGTSFTTSMVTIPNINTAGWGTDEDRRTIRNAARIWCAANGANSLSPRDIDLIDGGHQSQAGSITLAHHFYRSLRPSLGLSHGDAGPVIASATRAADSADVVVSLTLPGDATTLVEVGNIESRFLVAEAGGFTPLTISSATVGTDTITLTLASAPANNQALDVWFAYLDDTMNDGQSNMVYDDVTDGDGITQGRQMVPNLASAVTAAAPGAVVQVGPNLTPDGSPTYGAGASGFDQELNSRFGLSGTTTDVLPASDTWTMEAVVSVSSAPGSTMVAMGASEKGFIGIASDGRLVATYRTASSTDVWLGGGNFFGGSSNPVITGGARYHIALVANGASGAALYVDGVLASSSGTATTSGAAATVFGVGSAGTTPASYIWPGTIDEVAVWSTAKYTSGFTVPSTPYVGDETGLIALYHLDGDMNAATYGGAPDATAPILSSPTDTANGSSAMTGTVSTDEGNGTLYWFISTSGTPPSSTDLKAGTGAVAAGSQAVEATGVQNISDSGLTAETGYFTHYLHRDAAGNDSAIVSASGFTTAAAGSDPVAGATTLVVSTGGNSATYNSSGTPFTVTGGTNSAVLLYIAVEKGTGTDPATQFSMVANDGATDYNLNFIDGTQFGTGGGSPAVALFWYHELPAGTYTFTLTSTAGSSLRACGMAAQNISSVGGTIGQSVSGDGASIGLSGVAVGSLIAGVGASDGSSTPYTSAGDATLTFAYASAAGSTSDVNCGGGHFTADATSETFALNGPGGQNVVVAVELVAA